MNITYLEKMVKALAMASPWCMRVRYPDMAHCVEASVGGAGALKRRGIEAKTIPCAFVAGASDSGDEAYVCAVGHTAKSAYEFVKDNCPEAAPPLEDCDMGAFPDSPLHVIIEATHCGKRALIDLTAGQVRQASGGRLVVPNAVIHDGDGWPSINLDNGVWLKYGPSPCRETTRAPWRDYKDPGLVGDMHDLMGVALDCDLDVDRFIGVMKGLARSVGYRVR